MAYEIGGGNLTVLPATRRQPLLSEVIADLADTLRARKKQREDVARRERENKDANLRTVAGALPSYEQRRQVFGDELGAPEIESSEGISEAELIRILKTPDEQLTPDQRMVKWKALGLSGGETWAKILGADAFTPGSGAQTAGVLGGTIEGANNKANRGERERHNKVIEGQGGQRTTAYVGATGALEKKRNKETEFVGKGKPQKDDAEASAQDLLKRAAKLQDKAAGVTDPVVKKGLLEAASELQMRANTVRRNAAQMRGQAPQPTAPDVAEPPEPVASGEGIEHVTQAEYDALIADGLTPEEIEADGIRVR